MKSIYGWITRHTGLCKGILFFILTGFTLYTTGLPYVSFISIYLIDLALWFLGNRLIAAAPGKLARDANEQLTQHCDPYPLLELMDQMAGWNLPGYQQQVAQMDYAAALRETGRYHKALEVLESIHIDKFPGTSPYVKYIYYHNLCDVLYLLDHKDEARIWYKKSLQLYEDIPPIKVKEALSNTYDLMAAEVLHYEGNHEEALHKVSQIKLLSPRNILDAAMLAAKCHIALQQPEQAREKLQYIIEHGNRLYAVEEAKSLLETLI